MKEYLKCYSCRYILENDKSIVGQLVCPRCSRKNWYGWPESEVVDLYTFIEKYDLTVTENKLAACIFLSSLLELLLEKQVADLAYQEALVPEYSMLVDILLDTYQGRSRLLRLYNRLGYHKFSEDLHTIGFGDFDLEWSSLAQIRNRVVHGEPKAIEDLEPGKIEKILSTALDLFSSLNNLNSENYSDNKMIREEKNEKEVEARRLQKWINSVKGDDELDIL